MSLKSKRLTILLGSEIQDLYGAPKLTHEQKRYYFSLNDPEVDALRSFRDNYNRLYFVLLLGYFKVKPVVLNFRYGDVGDDLQFIATEIFPGVKLKRKNLSPAQKTRMYRRIFQLLGYQPFADDSEVGLNRRAVASAAASIESRFLFDESIDYLAKQRIAIPKYTILQRVISTAIASERQRLADILSRSISQPLSERLEAILHGDTEATLNSVRKSAKNYQLRRAVASVNGNRFRGSSDQEIDIWNECARLLTNAIIYFNSLILSNLLTFYRATGDQENLELVKKVSPVAWVNVNLNGTYSFTFEKNMINMAEVLSPLTGKMGKIEK